MKLQAAFFAFLLGLSWIASAADKPRVEDIAGKLACYCGTCPHLVVSACGCSTADQIKVDIQKKIDQGQSEDQIIHSFVAQYGQTVLAAPTKSGFNLTAWAIPFVAFVIGGSVLFAFLKKQRNSHQREIPEPRVPDVTDEYYRDRVNQELEERK
jgi:cytochrome c-type biogenesis protein CcmH